MELSAKLTFDKLVYNKDNTTHLVVGLTAPLLDWVAKRPPVAIMLVADVSGSMRDDGKLEFAKKSMYKLVDHLQPGDYCGLTIFESQANLVNSLVEMSVTNKKTLKDQITKLRPLGGTAFVDGMLVGLKECNSAKLSDNVLKRVIIFTDGQTNVGPKGKDILPLVKEYLGTTSISAFGYGEDADQEMLADVSSEGKGNYAFIKDAESAPKAFAKELGGLLSTYAKDIKVEVTPREGCEILELFSELPKTIDSTNKTMEVSFPEILSEETRNFVFSFKTLASIAPINKLLAKVKISYESLNNKINIKVNEKIVGVVNSQKSESIDVSVDFVNPGEEKKSPHDDVDAIVALAEMSHAQAQAEKMAKQGNYQEASSLMNVVSRSTGQRGFGAIAMTASKLGDKMKDLFSYRSSEAYRTSSYAASTRSVGTSSLEPEVAADMASIGVVMTNSAQNQISESFTDLKPGTGNVLPEEPSENETTK